MKRLIASLLVALFILIQIIPTVTAMDFHSNPFDYADEKRQESIESSLGTSVPAKKPTVAPITAVGTRYAVKFKQTASLSTVYDCVKHYGYELLGYSEQRIFSIYISDISEFRSNYKGIVEIIEEDAVLSLSATVNDPLAKNQWELEALNLYEAWDISKAKNDITVAVLDSGIYRQHEEFDNCEILSGFDAVTDTDGIDFDCNGHGTKVVSILAAASNNRLGMASAAHGVTVLPIRVSDNTGFVYSTDFIQALYYAADSGVDVINMSFGGYVYSAAEESAVEYAASKGCIMVSAAGNEGLDNKYAGMKSYPASYNNVISVGSINENGEVCAFSQYNDSVDLVAPGSGLTVANFEGGYENESGTSFSTAYVSGIICLALSAIDEGYGFTSDQFVNLIAEINGFAKTNSEGYGTIDAVKVLENINLPMYSGVADESIYHHNITVYFNRGVAKLDGEEFKSGDMVVVSGRHVLNIEDGENVKEISFVTDNIPLTYEYTETNNKASIIFDRGSATLDGAPYISGSDITTDGKHYFIITGPYGNTETYEFECSFSAPKIFGVKNGGYYTSPVYFSTSKAESVTLNNTPIEHGKAITANGSYTLTVKNKNAEQTVYFTVAIPNIKNYDSSVANGKIAVDNENSAVYLYNSVLSGIRVLSESNLNQTQSFVRTNDGIIGHAFSNGNFILLHEKGISIIPQDEISQGNSYNLIYFPFKGTAKSPVFANDKVYYISTDSNGACALRCMSTVNGNDEVAFTFVDTFTHLAHSDGTFLLASDSGSISAYDTNGVRKFKINTAVPTSKLVFADGYFSNGSLVYDVDSKSELFALKDNEKPLRIQSGILITNCSVYTIADYQRVGAFETELSDFVIDDNNKVYKYLSNQKLQIIEDTSVFSVKNANRKLNAAPLNETIELEATQSSVFEQSVLLPADVSLIEGALIENVKELFAISASNKALYIFDSDSLQLKKKLDLRFSPSSICSDGTNIYVSFANKEYIYKSKGSIDSGIYIVTNHAYASIKIYNENIYALTASGDLFAFSSADAVNTERVIIKNQKVNSFDVEGDYIYAHLSPASLSFIYKIRISSCEVEETAVITASSNRVFATSNCIIVGSTAYSINDLSALFSFKSKVSFADDNYILTEDGLYSDSFELLGVHRHSTLGAVFDKNYNYYSVHNDSVIKIRSHGDTLSALPEIDGIIQDETLDGPVYPVYSFGLGYIDGVYIESGTPIENGGKHVFTICKPFGVSKECSFYIKAVINKIQLSYPKTTIAVNETLKATVSAFPIVTVNVDTVFNAENGNAVVYSDGTVIGVKPGTCTITATTSDGLHSASYTLTVVESKIEFDSSYFKEEEGGVVGNIAPGTSIETLYSAVELTNGKVVVTTKDGTEVNVGVISTDMKVLLYDINGDVIDERALSVFCDVDCDGYITANDYYTLQKISEQPYSISLALKYAADTDRSGKVDVFDLLVLKEHLLGKERLEEAVAMPERTARAIPWIIMPRYITRGTDMTISITLSESQNVSAISGVITYSSTVYTVTDVQVPDDVSEGFFSIESDGIYFFANCNPLWDSEVVITVSFAISELYNETDDAFIACSELKLYDGNAASCESVKNTPAFSKNTIEDICIFNMPGFEFEKDTTYYELEFPKASHHVYISAYPDGDFVITGNTAFSEGTAAFSVVKEDDSETKYNFVCKSELGDAPLQSETESSKNNNSFLQSVTVENGTLSPEFSKNIFEYYIVCKDFDLVKVAATPEAESSLVEIKPLDKEANAITVECTANGGNTKIYTFKLVHNTPADIDYPEDPINFVWLWILLGVFISAGLATLVVYQHKLITSDKE